MFEDWTDCPVANTAYIALEFLPEKAPIWTVAHRARGSSLDSGFQDRTRMSPHTSPSKIGPRETANVISINIKGILKTNVALVTEGINKFAAKLLD